MSGPSSPIEERLLHGYREQLSRYDRAAEILKEGETNGGLSSPDQWAHALHATLLEAAALDAAMAQDIAAWRALGQTVAGPLREILECLAQRIRAISESIDRRMNETQASQKGLVVEIDEFIQKRRMLQAYVKQ